MTTPPEVTELVAPGRPRPLQEAAEGIARIQAMWVGAGTTVVSAGLITAATHDVITALLGFIPGALALAATILGAFGVARKGEPLVTPVVDPRDDTGRALLPAPPPPPMLDTVHPID